MDADTSIEVHDIEQLRADLIAGTRDWADGKSPSAALTEKRHSLLLANHRSYLDGLTVYAELASGLGIGRDVDVDTLVNELMFSDQIFKSYPAADLDQSKFDAMTDWLRTLFVGDIPSEVGQSKSLKEWRMQLRLRGVHLNYSSGTSGRMSFIPRDASSWRALSENSKASSDMGWFFTAEGKPKPFACLVVGPKGTGMGIQAAATGLARMAAQSHFLFRSELDEESVRRLTRAPTQVAHTSVTPSSVGIDSQQDAYGEAFRFLESSAERALPTLVFGAPFQLRRLCEQLERSSLSIELPPSSVVSSGGGWKSFQNERVSRDELITLIQSTLGVSPASFIDAYSTAEINCAFLSCVEGHYHIPPLIEPVVLDDAYTGAVGQPGHGLLGFLDPFATSYPGFIVTGDLADLAFGSCACGLSGAYLKSEVQRAAGREIKGCGGVMAAAMA